MAVLGHHQPIPMSEVAFPSIQRKQSNADENWGVPIGQGSEVALKQDLLKPFGTRLVYICVIW